MPSEDLRRSLPVSSEQTGWTVSKLHPSRRSFPQLPKPKAKQLRHKKLPCYDWLFSCATNAHIVIDKFWFKTFTPFETYALTVAGSKQISMRGIGSVDLKIRCKPNSHQSRIITLDNVLYIPGWVCNIFSDCYFDTDEHKNEVFEHTWKEFGVCFTKNAGGKIKPWGYTEGFCGLDRLVLSRKQHGRSPMLEDLDRDVWSINLHWPQSQQDKWEAFRARELQKLAKEHEAEILAQQQRTDKQTSTESTELLIPKNTDTTIPNPKLKSPSPVSASRISVRSQSRNNLTQVTARQVSAASLDLHHAGARISLSEINSNKAIPTRSDSKGRVSSLKATVNTNRGLLKEFLAR